MEKILWKWCVAIFAFLARHLSPTLSVLYGTKKKNPYARYFLPSVEKQQNIARLLSDEAIEARVWDTETIYGLIIGDFRAVFLGELPDVMGERLRCLIRDCGNNFLRLIEYPVPFLKAILPLLENESLGVGPDVKDDWLQCAEKWVSVHDFQRFLLTNEVCSGNLRACNHWAKLREAIFQQQTGIYNLVKLLNLLPTAEEEERYGLVKKLDKAYMEGKMSAEQKKRYIFYLAEKKQDSERISENWRDVVAETNALIRERYASNQ